MLSLQKVLRTTYFASGSVAKAFWKYGQRQPFSIQGSQFDSVICNMYSFFFRLSDVTT